MTEHSLDSEYGFYPPLLSLAHPEAIAMLPGHGSCDLVTLQLRAEPLSVDQVIYSQIIHVLSCI